MTSLASVPEAWQFVTLFVTILGRIYGTLKIIHKNRNFLMYRSNLRVQATHTCVILTGEPGKEKP